MLFFTYLAMFVVMTPLTLAQEPRVFAAIPHFSFQTWIGLALLTFFHNYLSMVLFLKALKQLDAIQAALSNYLITFFGIPIAAIWLKERLTGKIHPRNVLDRPNAERREKRKPVCGIWRRPGETDDLDCMRFCTRSLHTRIVLDYPRLVRPMRKWMNRKLFASLLGGCREGLN